MELHEHHFMTEINKVSAHGKVWHCLLTTKVFNKAFNKAG